MMHVCPASFALCLVPGVWRCDAYRCALNLSPICIGILSFSSHPQADLLHPHFKRLSRLAHLRLRDADSHVREDAAIALATCTLHLALHAQVCEDCHAARVLIMQPCLLFCSLGSLYPLLCGGRHIRSPVVLNGGGNYCGDLM